MANGVHPAIMGEPILGSSDDNEEQAAKERGKVNVGVRGREASLNFDIANYLEYLSEYSHPQAALQCMNVAQLLAAVEASNITCAHKTCMTRRSPLAL
jgi:hypothetical protein